jgi:glycosyltransferase involved in cell wall biosynthesis
MMKHIIHINDKLTLSGGVEVYISQVQDQLRQRGWKSDWVALTKTGSRVAVQSDNQELCWEGEISELAMSALASSVSGGKGAFHVHSLSEPELLEALFTMAPVVRTAHEPRMVCPGQGKFWAKTEEVCPLPAGKHCLLHAYTKRCCNRHPKRLLKAYHNVQYELDVASQKYARVLANSDYSERLLLESGFPREVVTCLPYFTEISPEIGQRPVGKIVFIGRLSSTKGVHYLLHAMQRVHASMPEVRLVLLGDGHDRQKFEDLAETLQLSKVVEFAGWADRERVAAEIAQAAVVAFPSIYPEAFGISGIEAMAHGKPVVGFDVGGVSDWLRDGVNGSLVPVKDTDAYAEALLELLQNPSLAQSYGQAGREIVEREFSPEAHMDQLTQVYETSQLTPQLQS